jgi:polysaccharide export outer membrane protein
MVMKLVSSEFVSAVALLAALSCAGQTQVADVKTPAQPDSIAANREFNERNPRYHLSRGDVLDIAFPRTPEFNQTATVQPDGFIDLHGAGDVHVLGLTVPAALEAIKTAYAKILHDPLVTLELKEFDKPYFSTWGQITKPGRYDLRGDITVTQAIALSGGFKDGAKDTEILLLRRVSADLTEVKRIGVKQMMKSGDFHEDPFIQSGDILYIPKSKMGKIDKFLPNSSVGAMMKPY